MDEYIEYECINMKQTNWVSAILGLLLHNEVYNMQRYTMLSSRTRGTCYSGAHILLFNHSIEGETR